MSENPKIQKMNEFCLPNSCRNSHAIKENRLINLVLRVKSSLLLSFFVFFSLLILTPMISATMYERFNTGDDDSVYGGGAAWLTQTFTVGITGSNHEHLIQNISVMLYRSGTPETCIIAIRETNSSGAPIGADLVNGTFNGTTLTEVTNGEWKNFRVNGSYILKKNTKYGLVLRCNITATIYWRADISSSSYAGGGFRSSVDSGGNWSADSATIDTMFEIHGNYTDITPSDVSIIYPENKSYYANESYLYNINYTYFDNNTASCWYSTNGGITNSSTVNAKTNFTGVISIEGNNTWTVYCNDSYSNQNSSSVTFIKDTQINIISQTFNYNTIEGSYETFTLNVSYDHDMYTGVYANLYYNNTNYGGSRDDSENEESTVFSRSINAPNVASVVNISFYWKIGLSNSSGIFYYNSTAHNQTVTNISIDDCSVYSNLILNYTLFDEISQELINGTWGVYNSTIEIDLQLYPFGSSVSILNYSKNFSGTDFLDGNNIRLCLSYSVLNTTQHRLYVQTKYAADGYESEYNYLQNFTMRNSSIPQHIKLYDLLTLKSTKFLVTFKDENFVPVENAIISLERKYVGEGVFKTVEMGKTSRYGETNLHIDLVNNAIYNVIVSKDGEILATFSNQAFYCDDAIEECKITLNAAVSSTDSTDFYIYENIGYIFTFNQSSRILKVDFVSLDNSVVIMIINATKLTGYMNETLCTNTLESSSGQLVCSIPSVYANITFIADLYKNEKLIASRVYSVIPKALNVFGENLVIYLLVMIISLVFMFIPSLIGVIFGLILGIITATYLFLTSGNIIGFASSTIWFLVAIFIILWRINAKGGG